VEEKTAKQLALKQPRVLLVPPDQLEPRVTDLAGLLKVRVLWARVDHARLGWRDVLLVG
jgi:hypothetical protein